MSTATPTLAQVMLNAIEARLNGLHTLLPGKVVSVDVKAGKCDVQPLLKRLGSDGNPATLPQIKNCPIGFYRAGSAAVYLPLQVGDGIEIKFCERSLDIWLTKGGTIDPEDKRKHHLSDAVVYPGMYDFTDPPSDADPTKLVIVNSTSKITLSPDGKFTMTGAGGEDVLHILSDLIAKLQTVEVPTMMGPQMFLPTDILDLEAIQERIDGIRG